MENHKVVMQEHMNQFGFLFGGYLLQWVDEYAWIAASLDYPGCNFVTVGMDRVEFKKSVRLGTILRFEVKRKSAGTTSVEYGVAVFRGGSGADEEIIFSTAVTLVRVDEEGRKQPLP